MKIIFIGFNISMKQVVNGKWMTHALYTVMNAFGYVPKRDETVEVNGFVFKVLRSSNRRINLLEVERAAEQDKEAKESDSSHSGSDAG